MVKTLDISALDLQDALDLAVLIEKEAAERYLMFAAQLGTSYRGDAADFFAMMARNEQRHGMELAQRRRSLFGDAPSRVAASMLDDDIEAPGTGTPRPHMSPRHAMEVAMASEVKAYEFFDQALPGIRDAAVRKLFEELRTEELEHQKILRERMAASSSSMEPDIAPEDIDTPAL